MNGRPEPLSCSGHRRGPARGVHRLTSQAA
jgi:hypothetical protein